MANAKAVKHSDVSRKTLSGGFFGWIGFVLMAPFRLGRALPVGLDKLAMWFPLLRLFIVGVLELLMFMPLVFICPVPIGPMKRLLVGQVTVGKEFAFFSHSRMIIWMHVIWAGWVVAVAALVRSGRPELDWLLQNAILFWLLVLIVTALAITFDFNALAAMLVAALALVIILVGIIFRLPILYWVAWLFPMDQQTPDWTVPVAFSAVIGLVYTFTAAVHRRSGVWTMSADGNYLKRKWFESGTQSINLTLKDVKDHYPCMLKKHLWPRLGNVTIEDRNGKDEIPNCICAGGIAETVTERHQSVSVHQGKKPSMPENEAQIVEKELDE